MKRFLLLYLVFLASADVYSDGYMDYVKQPCYPVSLGGEWEGPKEYTLFSDTLSGVLFCNHCRFTVVYHDMYTTTPDEQYYIAVVGVFIEGGPECRNCDLQTILNTFYECKLKHLSVNPDPGKPDMEDMYGPWLKSHTMHYTTPGKCTSSGSSCSTEQYCCVQNMQVEFDDDYRVIEVTPAYTWDINPVCLPPCVSKCKDIPFLPKDFPPDINDCDIPCNFGDWEFDFRYVPIEACPDCQVRIDFKHRISQGENCPEFKDYKILGLHLDGCESCPMYGAELFEYSMHWLLKNGPIDPPEENHCDTNFRVVNAPCWRLMNDHEFHPCANDNCCWSQYKICNPLRPEDPEKIDQSDNQMLHCEATNACVFVCDNNLPRIALPKDEEEIKKDIAAKALFELKSNYCEAILTVENSFAGDIVLEISNTIGNTIYKETYLKMGYNLNANINIKDCTNGSYFYRILQNGICIGKGSFVVTK